MGLCNCFGECDCLIEGAGQVSVSGSGDVADPFIITGLETPFDLTSLSAALVVTPGGSDGHEPSIDLAIDPASTAPVSVTPQGLLIDCCSAAGSVSPDICNDLTDVGNGLYADSGLTVVSAGSPTQVDIPTTGNTSAVSWQRDITNNEACDLLVHVSGQPRADTEINLGIDVELEIAARLTITSAHTWIGGGTQRSLRWNYYRDGADVSPGRDMIWIDDLAGWAVIPAGETLTVQSNCAVSFKQNLLSDAASGRGYTFQTPTIFASKVRNVALDVVGA
jgi:hypothetical protein